jgi:membrane-bound metal-dependent hydrolase YbcI (DUF457 family)
MPLPLGHTAIGLAAYHSVGPAAEPAPRWKLLVWIILLANLPDSDVVLGLLVDGNGNLFHRGPTHSLVFALTTGYLAARAGRLSRHIPALGFVTCFLLVFSHVVADMVFTTAPVSLLWPFEVHWSAGHSGWGQVAYAAIFESIRDTGIFIGALVYIGCLRGVRKWLPDGRVPVPVRRRPR